MAAQTLRILVIEDNPGDVRLLEEMLVPTSDVQYEVQSFGNLSDGLGAVSDFDPAVILLDLGLGETQGLDTFTAAQEGAGDVPIVILSGLGDEMVATAAVGQGAQDYLVKGEFEEQRLRRTIRYAIERQRRTATAEERIRTLAAEEPGFADIVMNQPDGVIVADSTRKVLFANPAAAELFTVPVDDLVGSELEFNVRPGASQMVQIREDPRNPKYLEAHSAQAVWSGSDVHVLTFREGEHIGFFRRILSNIGF